jgi:hypothetical protein
MENHQLSYFEKLISNELNGSCQEPPNLFFFKGTCSAIKLETEGVLQYFNYCLFNISDEKEIALTARVYQRKIIPLIDKVSRHLEQEDIINIDQLPEDATWKNLYKALYNSLTSILGFIETEWARYLDVHAKVPVAYLLIARQKIDLAVQVLSAGLKPAGIDETLLSLVLHPFKIFLKDQAVAHVTYHKLFYLKVLVKGLSGLLPVNVSVTGINRQILEVLQELNFNCKKIYDYCTGAIRREVEALPQRERLERLIWIQKQINQVQTRAGVAYAPSQTGLQQQLKHWVAEEIYCMKETARSSGNNVSTDDACRWKGYKVLTRFSVAQLGYAIKLLVDTGIFISSNKKELLEFFSVFFGAANQENISAGSLRNNFYNGDAAAVAGVREILISLLNQSQKDML